MRLTQELPVPATEVEGHIRHALLELREARREGDAYRVRLAERRMNVLLDRLAASWACQ